MRLIIFVTFPVLLQLSSATYSVSTPDFYFTGALYCPLNKAWKRKIIVWEIDTEDDGDDEDLTIPESTGTEEYYHFNFVIRNVIDMGNLTRTAEYAIHVEHTCTNDGSLDKKFYGAEIRVPLTYRQKVFHGFKAVNLVTTWSEPIQYEKLFTKYLDDECAKTDCEKVRNRITDKENGCALRNWEQFECLTGFSNVYCGRNGAWLDWLCGPPPTTTTLIPTTTEKSFPITIVVGVSMGIFSIFVAIIAFICGRKSRKEEKPVGSTTATLSTSNSNNGNWNHWYHYKEDQKNRDRNWNNGLLNLNSYLFVLIKIYNSLIDF